MKNQKLYLLSGFDLQCDVVDFDNYFEVEAGVVDTHDLVVEEEAVVAAAEVEHNDLVEDYLDNNLESQVYHFEKKEWEDNYINQARQEIVEIEESIDFDTAVKGYYSGENLCQKYDLQRVAEDSLTWLENSKYKVDLDSFEELDRTGFVGSKYLEGKERWPSLVF